MLRLTLKDSGKNAVNAIMPDGRIVTFAITTSRRGRCEVAIDAPMDIRLSRTRLEEPDADNAESAKVGRGAPN